MTISEPTSFNTKLCASNAALLLVVLLTHHWAPPPPTIIGADRTIPSLRAAQTSMTVGCAAQVLRKPHCSASIGHWCLPILGCRENTHSCSVCCSIRSPKFPSFAGLYPWSTVNLSASIFLQGVDQEILPCGQGRIDNVKINPSLLMLKECKRLLCYL